MAQKVRLGGLQIPALLFADDVVLFASSIGNLQLMLRQFRDVCEVTGMRHL